MQKLSTVLENISPQSLEKTQPTSLTVPLGSTQSGGMTLSPRRDQPLTESQLTAIASQTLLGRLEICYEKKTIYGRKQIDGVWHDHEPVAQRDEVDMIVPFRPEVSAAMLRAALALSPADACLKHLTHLTLHKRLGSTDADRKILLVDYVKGLADFPEFVLHAVCKAFWERDPREPRHHPFMPTIPELAAACTVLLDALKWHLRRVSCPRVASTPQPRLETPPTPKISPANEARRMLSLAEQNPQFLDVAFWAAEVVRREAVEQAENLKKEDGNAEKV